MSFQNTVNSVNVLMLTSSNTAVITDGTNTATLSPSEFSLIDGLTAGTVTASKAVVVDSNKDISLFRNLSVTNLDAGASGTAGTVDVYPTTVSTGKLQISAVSNAGDTVTVITNAVQAGARTYTIPDSGASASFMMTEGAQTVNGAQTFTSTVSVSGALTSATAKSDFQIFIGINDIIAASVGTWTITRIAQSNYSYRHTAADETAIIGIDVTPYLRTTASKGFSLSSFDVIYTIGTAALDAHSVTLDSVSYANNVAVLVTSVPISATLATSTQANPYVTNCTVTTPAFLTTADAKYVIELTVNAAATTAYDYHGIVLRFSRNDL